MKKYKVFRGFTIDEWLYFKFSQKCRENNLRKGEMIEALIESFVFPESSERLNLSKNVKTIQSLSSTEEIDSDN